MYLKEEALKKHKGLEHHNREACKKPTAGTQTGAITAEIIKSTTTDKGSQCPEATQTYLMPEMMADVVFLKKVVALYKAHKSEMATVEHPIKSPLPEMSSIAAEAQDTSAPAVKTGYTISKLEGIQTTKRGGKNTYIDNRRRSPLTKEWVTKEQADAEEASGIRLKKHQRISKGYSDLSRIKEKIMYRISEKYRANRRATYARYNMNKKLKQSTDKVTTRNKAEASFQKTMSHKKLIEYFQFTEAAMGDKALPPEFDCTLFPEENLDAYYQAVITSYMGKIINAQGSMIMPNIVDVKNKNLKGDENAVSFQPDDVRLENDSSDM